MSVGGRGAWRREMEEQLINDREFYFGVKKMLCS